MEPTIQISLDLTNIDEALAMARVAVRAGVDWLEAGTPDTQGLYIPAH
jgi:3-hexulose-6-phosphate synthase